MNSRRQREGFYDGKHKGKHYRCPIVVKTNCQRITVIVAPKERYPTNFRAMIEAVRKGN